MSLKTQIQEFVTVYHTPNITSGDFHLNHGLVRLGVTRRGKVLNVTDNLPLAVAGRPFKGAVARRLRIPAGEPHAYFIASVEADDLEEADRKAQILTDRVALQVSLLHGRDVFHTLIYRGPLLEPKGAATQVKVTLEVVPQENIRVNRLRSDLASFDRSLEQAEFQEQCGLMAHFYNMAMQESVLELKFLLFWFSLEVFPLRGGTKISVIHDFVAAELLGGLDRDAVAKQLQLGRLYGLRGDLVHQGRWLEDRQTLKEATNQVKSLVWETLRWMGGLDYSGRLDEYLGSNA